MDHFCIKKILVRKTAGNSVLPFVFCLTVICLLFMMVSNSEAAIAFRSADSNAITSVTSSVTYIGSGSSAGITGCGNVNPSIPAGNTGDLLIALAVGKETDVGVAISMSGWNTYYSASNAGGDNNSELQTYIFWRVATGSDPNTITQTGGACSGFGGQISRFRGVDTTSPFETVSPGVVYQNSDNIDTGTITTTSATAMLLVAGFVSDNGTVTEGAGWTQAFEFAYNDGGAKPDFTATLNYQLQTTAGNKSISNWAFSSGTDENLGAIFALTPAVGGLTINVPAGTTTDDVMIAVIGHRQDTGVTITPPSGWTLQSRVTQGTGVPNVQEVFMRVATGAEPASYTWVFSGTITGAAGGIVTYSGVDTSSVVNVIGGNATPSGTSHTANSVTTTVANTMVISAHSYASSETWTPPAGMTERVDIASLTTPNAGGISLEINDVTQAAIGATGNKTATVGGNNDSGVAHLVALTPLIGSSTCQFSTGLNTGLPGEYFNNMTLTDPAAGLRVDGPVDFNWAGGTPGVSGIGADNFSVRWEGVLRITSTDTYRFQTVSDDGVRLYVDNVLVIDNWTNHAATTDTSTDVVLTAGNVYDIRLEYFENGGQSEIRLRWGDATNSYTYTAIPTGPSPAYGEGLYYCSVPPAALAEWRMDETTWNGTADEVVDEMGGYNGTAQNGAVTNNASPAVAGNPGTCGYGSFDGTDDYVDVTNLSDILNGTASLAFWINTTQTGNNAAWQAPGVTGVEEAGGANDIFWGWIDASGNIGVSVGNDFTTKSTTAINDGGWHHVVLTRNASSGAYTIYIDGSLNKSGTLGTGTIGNTYTSIGRIEDTGGTPVYLNGQLDEVRVYNSVLGITEVSEVMNDTHSCSSGPIAYYRMDETWTVPAASEVIDYSGNGNHGDTIASGTGTLISNDSTFPAITGDPGTCGYGVFPANTGDTQHHAVDSKLTPGNTGSVTLWYRADSDWVGSGNLKLLDASSGLTSRFFLTKMNTGALRFRFEDAAGTATQAQTAVQTFLANEWVHIGITWDLTNNRTEIYINGTLSATSTTAVTTAAAWNSLYIGDNRAPGLTGTGNSARSAAGLIDEVRIYDGVILQTDVDIDRLSTHPCTLVDHYKIEVITSSPGACDPVEIKVTAHNVIDAATNVTSGTILNFSTLTGTSTWGTKIAGTGTWTPAGATATYNWPGGESAVQVEISNVASVTENVNLDDGTAKEPSGSAEDPDITFNTSPLIRITNNGSSAGSIATEIAGKNSNQAPAQTLYIQLKQSGITNGGQDACEVSGYYSGTYNVQVAAECINPGSCITSPTAKKVTVNGVAVNTYNSGTVPGSGSWSTVSFTFDGTAGDLTTTTDNKAPLVINYPESGKMILHFDTTINPPGPGGFTPSRTFTGSSNNFVVRPFGFRIDGFSPANPAAVDENGGIFTKAGQNFTANITAVVWQSADDDGSTCNLTANPSCLASDGIPDSNSSLTGNATTLNFGNESTAVIANISHSLRAPVNASAQQGTLTGSGNVSGFASGVISNHAMSWDEVGIIQLDVNESNNDYLSGGQDVTGLVPYLGRFTPANLTVQVLGSANFDNSCSTGNFTYLDQTFYYGPTANDAPRLRVRGVDTNGNITFNYDSGNGAGGFWKLNSTTLPRTYTDAAGVASTLDPPIAGVNQDTDVTYLNMGNYNGLVNLRLDRLANGDPFLYQRVSEEAPFNASVNLTFNAAGLIDDDGVCYDGDGDTICDGTTPTPLSTDDDFVYGTITGTELRFGRLVLDNAFGSELLALDIPVRAEYFNGDDFITNTDDVCSTYRASNVSLTDVTGADSLVPGDTTVSSPVSVTTLVNGEFDPANPIILNAPGVGKTGSLDVLLDLSTATGLDQEWLRYDWDGDSNYDNDPTARATWGIYSGPDEFIYLREPW